MYQQPTPACALEPDLKLNSEPGAGDVGQETIVQPVEGVYGSPLNQIVIRRRISPFYYNVIKCIL